MLVSHLKSMYLIIYVVAGHRVEQVEFTIGLWYSTNMHIFLFAKCLKTDLYMSEWKNIFFFWLVLTEKWLNLQHNRMFGILHTGSIPLSCVTVLKKNKCKLELLRKQECLYWLTRPLIKLLFCVFLFFNGLIWLKGCLPRDTVLHSNAFYPSPPLIVA